MSKKTETTGNLESENDSQKMLALDEAEKQFQTMLASEIETYAPTIGLQEYFDGGADKLILRVKAWPRPVAWKDAEEVWQSTNVMEVEANGITHSLWLSAKSLRMGVVKAFQDHGQELLGRDILITRRPYVHHKFGKSFAYNVTVLAESEEIPR